MRRFAADRPASRRRSSAGRRGRRPCRRQGGIRAARGPGLAGSHAYRRPAVARWRRSGHRVLRRSRAAQTRRPRARPGRPAHARRAARQAGGTRLRRPRPGRPGAAGRGPPRHRWVRRRGGTGRCRAGAGSRDLGRDLVPVIDTVFATAGGRSGLSAYLEYKAGVVLQPGVLDHLRAASWWLRPAPAGGLAGRSSCGCAIPAGSASVARMRALLRGRGSIGPADAHRTPPRRGRLLAGAAPGVGSRSRGTSRRPVRARARSRGSCYDGRERPARAVLRARGHHGAPRGRLLVGAPVPHAMQRRSAQCLDEQGTWTLIMMIDECGDQPGHGPVEKPSSAPARVTPTSC